jgi:serine/threonine protein kinase
MQQQKQSCFDRHAFSRFLEERTGEQEEAEMLAHIGDCESCRMKLEQLTGGRNVWKEIQDQLGDKQVGNIGEETEDSEFGDRQRDLRKVQDMLAPTDNPEMMGRLGGYEICGVIGRGSAGIVVKALDPRLNRFVAIKMLAPVYSNNGCSRRRFEREGKAIASVKDPHVVPIHLVEEFQGTPYIVMQYMPDGSLDQRIKRNGPLEAREAICIGMQVAQGLEAAHKRGIVHRDVKPANVLLDNGVDGAMVSDFGLARVVDEATMTRSGSISGTPQFMSPEQAKGERVGPRSDLFSLGSMMYAACTGHAPFKSESVFGIIKKVCDSDPAPIRDFNPDIPEWMEAFVNRLHAKNPDDRFESAGQVSDLLSQELAFLQSPTMVAAPARNWWVKPVAPQVTVAPVKPVKTEKKNLSNGWKATLFMLGAVTASLIAVGGMFILDNVRNPPLQLSATAMTSGGSEALLALIREQNDELPKFENSVETTIDVKSGGVLFLSSNLGTLDVKTHDKSTVEMKLTHSVGAKDKDVAGKLFKSLELNYQVDAEEVQDLALRKGRDAVIIAKFPTKNLRDEEIQKIQNLEDLEDLKEQLLIRKNSHYRNAKFELRIPKKFTIDLQTSAGKITTTDIDGSVTLMSKGGSIEIGNATGEVNIKTHGGHVNVGDLGANANILTHGGNIEIGNVQGELVVESHGGSIEANEIKGGVDALTHGGHVQFGHVMGLATAKSHGGGITIWQADSAVHADAPAGSIRVNYVNQPDQDSVLKAGAGSVRVGYVEGLNFDIHAKTNLGKVSGPFLEKKTSHVEYVLNAGKHKLDALSQTGSIKFSVVDLAELRKERNSKKEKDELLKAQQMFDRAYDLHMEGRLDEAIIAHLKAAQHPSKRGIATYNVGCAWSLKGEKDKAFEALTNAIDYGFNDQRQFDTDSDLDSLRDDKRFDVLMQRLKASIEAEGFDRDNDAKRDEVSSIGKASDEVRVFEKKFRIEHNDDHEHVLDSGVETTTIIIKKDCESECEEEK